ncbi:MAG TPA: hypothetical protein VH256_07255 [Thermoleophilaceae bacterium]|nr:hypothetical protein [Thermoleophilaceae bacterium]
MRRTTVHAALLCAAALAATASPALAAGNGGASPGSASQLAPGQIGGGTSPDSPLPGVDPTSPVEPIVAGDIAALVHGVAEAPANAPDVVKIAIRAANRLRHKPYVWGGGHASFLARGYDCSGSVSYVLHAAGLLDSPLVSGALASWGEKGAGRWISVYANRGHAFIVIAGLRFDTSGSGQSGPRWRGESRWLRGFHVRHPAGL